MVVAKFPSSTAFDLIAEGLQNESDRKDAVKQGKAIFAFNIKNTSGEEKAWYLDLKKKGEVGNGTAPAGEKANVILSLSDADFAGLIGKSAMSTYTASLVTRGADGSQSAQKLFMGGKLKVKGDVMKATKMETVLKKAQQKQQKSKL